MPSPTRRACTLLLAGCLAALTGCARNSVAINQAAVAENDTKPGAPAKAADKAPTADGPPFRFPADTGGRMLGQLLTPPAQLPAGVDGGPKMRPLPPPDAVDRPEVPLPQAHAQLPQPLLHPRAPAPRPHAPPEEAPLNSYHGQPIAPTVQHLAAGATIRVASPDVDLPTPLPILARPDADRVSLEDPTSDDSLRAALVEVAPVRATPAPFSRQGLPDPFENAQTVRLKTPPPEDTTPVSTAPQPPK